VFKELEEVEVNTQVVGEVNEEVRRILPHQIEDHPLGIVITQSWYEFIRLH
jgi:hypothetical protein